MALIYNHTAVTVRDARVTLRDRGVVRLPPLRISLFETDIEIELSVLRNPRKYYHLPPPVVTYPSSTGA